MNDPVRFEQFEQLAWQEWERIPDAYRQGVDGLVIERRAQPHPTLPDVYTLGECNTESYPSEFGGPESIRSSVVLYYGSFFRLSRLDDAFDWEQELWETLTHELQHHLESLATEAALVDMDYAADESFKREQGEPYDPFFFRYGIPEAGGYRIEDEVYLERPHARDGGAVHFQWNDVAYEIDVPPLDADVVFVDISAGVRAAPARLYVVLVPPSTWRSTLRSLFQRREPRVLELERAATRVAAASDAEAGP